MFLEVGTHAHESAAGPQSGHEVGDVGNVAQDLWAGGRVVGSGVGLVGVLVQEHPVGVLVGQLAGQTHRSVGALFTGRRNDLGAEHLEGLAAFDRHVLREDDLDRVAADAGDHGQSDASVARRWLDDGAPRSKGAVGFGLFDHGPGYPVLD